jgi:hypothetical protein
MTYISKFDVTNVAAYLLSQRLFAIILHGSMVACTFDARRNQWH